MTFVNQAINKHVLTPFIQTFLVSCFFFISDYQAFIKLIPLQFEATVLSSFLKTEINLVTFHLSMIVHLIQHILSKCSSLNLNNVLEYFSSSEFKPSSQLLSNSPWMKSVPSSSSNVIESTAVSSVMSSAAS